MNFFPLYNNLIKDIPKKDITAKQKDEIIKNISKIDDNTKELIYVLIQFYCNNNEKTKNNIPYNGNKKESINKNVGIYDITWNLAELPIPLRQILYKFISLHMKQKDEDINREI